VARRGPRDLSCRASRGRDFVYASSKLATGLITNDLRVVDAALAHGTVAAHGLEIGRPGLTTAIEAATGGADLALGHPDGLTALTDIAALQLGLRRSVFRRARSTAIAKAIATSTIVTSNP
jgi:hypothetical protein